MNDKARSLSAQLIAALQNPALYDHPVREFQLVETHVSWVLLTGEYAYKIKKPVNFGFLDFSTLEKRHRCCIDEMALNQRLAPDLYEAVLAIGGTEEAPVLGAHDGAAIEYAIRMRQFDQKDLLSEMLAENRLRQAHLEEAAHLLANFHQSLVPVPADTPWGTPGQVCFPVRDNFRTLAEALDDPALRERHLALKAWALDAESRLTPLMERRKTRGMTRATHGDLHLGNMALMQGRVIFFDGIEFNEGLRFNDLMCELAFVLMDLEARGQPGEAAHFLNQYIERTQDLEGLALLPFYKSYRAMVRAKVEALTAGNEGMAADARQACLSRCERYTRLAESYTRRPCTWVLMTVGVSGSGKSWLSSQLADALNAIRLRSDVERKRLFNAAGLPEAVRDKGLYSRAMDDLTHQRLLELADICLEAGYPVILDATFIKADRRRPFLSHFAACNTPVLLLECAARPEILRQRVHQRALDGHDVSDADLDVLQSQLAQQDTLEATEQALCINANTEDPDVLARVLSQIYKRLDINMAAG
jgi:aminoglycoside phosphotransferase family enzyme/predicted kinase